MLGFFVFALGFVGVLTLLVRLGQFRVRKEVSRKAALGLTCAFIGLLLLGWWLLTRGATVEDRLGRDALGGVNPEIDEQVAQAVREVEERDRDQDEQIKLDDWVGQQTHVVRFCDVDDAQWAEDALEQDVHRQQDGGDHAALGEHEPPEEVG